MDIDTTKDIYLFLHGREDLKEKAIKTLTLKGFSRILIASSNQPVGQINDYMAVLWMPPNPDHIKIQKITKVVAVEPEGMIGLWKGVSKDDIGTIPL